MGAAIRFAGGRQSWRHLAIALVLAITFALPADLARAVDVPFRIESGALVFEGVGHLENGQFTGQAQAENRSISISGVIFEEELSIEVAGNICPPGPGAQGDNGLVAGAAHPAVGKLSITLQPSCGKVARTAIAYFNLPDTAPAQPPAAAAAPSPPAAPAEPAIEPLDATYIAIKPAKLRSHADVTAARIKTLSVGEKIHVAGKLKDGSWYLISENGQPVGYVIADQLVPEADYHPAVAAAPVAPPAQTAAPDPLAALDFGRYEALVIGNDDYRNGLPALHTAARDARAVGQMLQAAYGFKVTLLIDATRSQIIGALARLRQTLGGDDNLLIYYAGHGSYDEAADQGYWLSVDAMPGDPSNWVSNTDITNMLRAIEARHVLVVADSCYSGALTRGVDAGVRDANYIQRMVQKKARTVMTSGGLEPVVDSGGGGGHSVFAAAFLAALTQGSGVIDAEDLFVKVREPVVLASRQTPAYSNLRFAGHEGGDFIFVRKP